MQKHVKGYSNECRTAHSLEMGGGPLHTPVVTIKASTIWSFDSTQHFVVRLILENRNKHQKIYVVDYVRLKQKKQKTNSLV
jgi:uncharacterized protein YggL (DUF469 family)